MARPHITKTLGPIHFEDLDPHRFEDLVRELVYDFKDWQSIEATGRGGGDEGFDIRAYESLGNATIENDEIGPDEEVTHPMEGHVWMFQCKREKEIGPARIVSIISDGVDPKNPPYGYVLAAPANFSKTSYDKFREELRKRGVMEFYLWGCAALEDMLHLPKNDHILFTFFGISLVSRRRLRATEIRAVVSTKNKLFKLFEKGEVHHRPVLLRDTKDVNYPYETEYKDFKTRPRWMEYPVIEVDSLGLIVEVKQYFAFYDPIKKEWDFSDAVNLVQREVDYEERKNRDLRENVEGFWEFFQESNQARFIVDGFVRFDSIAVIDGEGDSIYKFPHIYVDFQADRGPFSGYYEYLEINEHHHEAIKGMKRIKKFPSTFSRPRIGIIHRDKTIRLDRFTVNRLKGGYHSRCTIYDCDNRYQFLNLADVIEVEQTQNSEGKILIKITNKREERAEDFLRQHKDDPTAANRVEEQIGRKLNSNDTITIYEVKTVREWELEKWESSETAPGASF
jgi:hypothetical protein